MRGRMLVRRRVAAADLPAGHAPAQVNPAAAYLQAFLTPFDRRRQGRHLDLVEMGADRALSRHLRLLSRENGDPEVAGGVRPPRLEGQAGAGRIPLDPGAPELRADLDPQPLVCCERQLDRGTLQLDRVRLAGAEAYVHPLVRRVPPRLVREAALVERRVQLAVDVRERVAYERLRHSRGVVVRRLEAHDVLDEVDADDERVVLLEDGCQRAEELDALVGMEVADRAA